MKKGVGVYYLGRVIKLGQLTTDSLIASLKNGPPVVWGANEWAFVDVKEVQNGACRFVFGYLDKYSPGAELRTVDPRKRAQMISAAPNLILASSPFVYIPEFSGISFLSVPGHIEPHIFVKRFCQIVESAHERFFVTCVVEMVADLQSFSNKLMKLESIHRISAHVSPPNPLFGVLWKPLKDYLRDRNSNSLKIDEQNTKEDAINTDLPKHLCALLDNPEKPLNPASVKISDAAILMAADGYGKGRIEGREKGKQVVVKTSETIKNFQFDKDPEPQQLYEAAAEAFSRIQKERHMDH